MPQQLCFLIRDSFKNGWRDRFISFMHQLKLIYDKLSFEISQLIHYFLQVLIVFNFKSVVSRF